VSVQSSYLIIGNGITGVTAAEILRHEDPAASITIVADDPFPVYYRPALKDYLAGRVPEHKLWARPHTFYQEHRIRFIPGRVVGINAMQHCVQLQGGQWVEYDKLLLASGARPRRLTCPGLDLAGVTTLRTVADYQEILRRLPAIERVIVYGGGTLALESAEALNQRGYQVTHLLRNNIIWSEVLDATGSDLVLQEERRAGIDVRTGEAIVEIVGKDGQVSGVVTSSGARLPCDLLLIAIGIEPIIDFIQVSGIHCGRGVRVDDYMRTNMPDIYAAGDVVETTDIYTGRLRVHGQWYPSVQQARTAANSMLDLLDTGQGFRPGAFYNATFLHGLDFVAIGLTTFPAQYAHYFQEVVADPAPRSYRKVVLKDGLPLGALFLGNRRHALAFKRAIDHRVNLAPVVSRLLADDFDLEEWLNSQGIPEANLHMTRQDSEQTSTVIVLASSGKLDSSSGGTSTLFQHIQGSRLHTSSSRAIPTHLLNAAAEAPSLIIINADSVPRTVSLAHRPRFIVGRSKECDIPLPDAAVSRTHAEIFSAPDGFYIRDLDSSNGVFVNKIKINNAYHLAHGDRVVIGNTLIYCSFPNMASTQRSTFANPPAEVQPRLAGAAASVPALSPSPIIGVGHREDIQTLTDQRLRFEIDMCIGCDRCMAACPVPMSSLITIADLNRATASETITDQVARFTQECVMCGSCVPVCPVDNHRDLLMLSLKQRVGISWQQEVDAQRIASALPAGWSVPQLLARLREQGVFGALTGAPERYVLHLYLSSRLVSLEPGATLIREGEYGRDLFFIFEGRLAVMTSEAGGKELLIGMLGRGEHIGEHTMLTGQPSVITVRAHTQALVLQVPEQVMQRYMELVPQARQIFEQLSNARSIGGILKRMSLFQGVSDADLGALIQQTQVRHYERGERLFGEVSGEGRPARETLHILLEGFVKVTRRTAPGTGHDKSDERIIAYRQSGDYFAGGLDLLGDDRAVSVTAISRTRVAEVPHNVMLALFQRYPEVNQRFTMRLRQYMESASATADAEATSARKRHPSHSLLHSLVNHGVVEGSEVLVIDLAKCIHCGECEEACERRHGHSRMNRKGMVIGNLSIATACRQCQDPVCMLCSRAGIARLPNGEVYITESCIGCGICAERCPYGAISIVDVADEAGANGMEVASSWQRFSSFFTKGIVTERRRGRKVLPMARIAEIEKKHVAPGPLDHVRSQDALEAMRKKIAIKCDLCAGYNDQACVLACPTGAAIRVQPARFFGSTEEILHR
jgi:NADPH-dependent 2,4-dienoyl-CoA reductase/sulfur reductase-like enzyme/CRP-like cAMP-binding protein/Fe-S-cluster-containing hydrogenase component 2